MKNTEGGRTMARVDYMSLILMAVLLFRGADAKEFRPITVRTGDDVALPCNVIIVQNKCQGTLWNFRGSGTTAVVALVSFGRIGEAANSRSDRLSVTEKCSLVIKNVTVEDVGIYTCRQFDRSRKEQSRTSVVLSVVTMTERQDDDEVALVCYLWTYEDCGHTVKWVYQGQDVGTDLKDDTPLPHCSATVHFSEYCFICTSNNESLKCHITNENIRKEWTFLFRPPSSGVDKNTGTTTTMPAITDASPHLQDHGWWVYTIVAVGLGALLVTVVAIIRRMRNKGNKSEMDHGAVTLNSPSLNPAGYHAAQETRKDPADLEDGVSYASISFIKKTKSKAQVRGDDDEVSAVIYSRAKAPSRSAGASADPCDPCNNVD